MTKQMNDETSSLIGFRKETITIDVPAGYEILRAHNISKMSHCDREVICAELVLNLKKKEPEFIEAREYLHRSDIYVLHNSIQKDSHQKASDIESLPGFIRWIDEDWRKIYI